MQKYLVCFAAALFSFYDLFQLSLFNVLNAQLLNHFQITPVTLGILSSCFLWGNAFGLIPVGFLLDYGYLRKTAFTLLGLSIIGSLVFAFSDSLSLAMVARFIQGFASAASLLICMRMGIHWFKEKANFAIGWMIVIALSGGIFGNSIYAYMMKFLDYQQGLIFAGVLGVIILSILIVFLHDNKSDTVNQLSLQNHFILFKKAIFKIRNSLMGIYLGLINFPVFILGTLWGNYYLSHFYHFSLIQASFLSTLIFVGIIIGSPFWGMLANKYINPHKVMYIGCIGLAILAYLFYILPSQFFILEVIFFGLGFFCCTQNISYYVLSEINQSEIISSATAIAAFIFNMIGASSQIIFGSIIEKSSSLGLLIFLPIIAFILLIIVFIYSNRKISYAGLIVKS
jgi:MFS family permease